VTADLRSWRLQDDDFDRVLHLRHLPGAPTTAALLLAAARLRARPLGAFSGIEEIFPDAGPTSTTASPYADALLDAILEPIDAELQRLYHACLATHEVGRDAWQQVEALSAVRAEAFAYVEQFDWQWLGEWFRAAGGSATWALRRLSNRAFPVRRVTLRFTYHCNISCRHCYNDSGPDKRQHRLAWPQMASVIEDMGRLGIPELVLTGGEPMMYLPDVTRAIGEARRHGIPAVRVFTNGFWGTSPAAATQVLTRLVDAGFGAGPADGLKVSAGFYHQEFLAAAIVAHIAVAHMDLLGRPLTVDIENGADGQGTVAIEHALERFAPGVPVSIVTREVVGTGRGESVWVPTHDGGDAPCRLIDQVTFDPDGSCRPCCGFNADNRGVRVGYLGELRLPDLIKRIQNDALLQYIAREPLVNLCTVTDTDRSSTRRPCELCQAAVGGLADRDPVLLRLQPQQRFYPFWFAPQDR
jgi:hypothetical protein